MDKVFVGHTADYGEIVEFTSCDVKGEHDGVLYVESDGEIVPVVPSSVEELEEL